MGVVYFAVLRLSVFYWIINVCFNTFRNESFLRVEVENDFLFLSLGVVVDVLRKLSLLDKSERQVSRYQQNPVRRFLLKVHLCFSCFANKYFSVGSDASCTCSLHLRYQKLIRIL